MVLRTRILAVALGSITESAAASEELAAQAQTMDLIAHELRTVVEG